MSELINRATASLDAAKRSYDHGFMSAYPFQLFEEMRDRLVVLEQAVERVRELTNHGLRSGNSAAEDALLSRNALVRIVAVLNEMEDK